MAAYRPAIMQYAWVVPRLEGGIRHWHETLGIGPFLVNRDIQVSDQKHRGLPSTTRFSTAVAQHGDVQIELVEQLDDSASAFRDTVPVGKTALHHVAFIPDDFDAALAHYAARGFAPATTGRFGDMRYAYVDTAASAGHMVEIVEDKPALRAFFGAIRKAAERWDGDPATLVRELGGPARS
ncbi:VOC family protein [Polymorphobacter sp.]|uniref:VOC family protein n=1 Tax=Polymorphobacter sp. TaxID=1909290 RepID=UPI003F721785